MKINYEWAMPNKETFKIQPIREFIMKYYHRVDYWIDPFANNCKLGKITNDLNPNFKTTYNLEAIHFLKQFEDDSIPGIFFDPPYSVRQIKEIYNSIGLDKYKTTNDFWSECKKEISKILKPNGICLSFGWNSVGIGKSLGFKKNELLIVCHGGQHNDTLCLAESKGKYFKNKSKLEKLLMN